MGSNTSKSRNEASVQTPKTGLDVVDTNADPRSPTPEISRTPLQSKSTSKLNITKNVDLRKTLENDKGEEKLIHNNPILSAVIKNHLLSYDPRSPTQEFERTPIIISSKINELVSKPELTNIQNGVNCGSPCLQPDDDNENYDSCVEAQESPDIVVPKNLCNGFFDMTLDDTIKDTEEPLISSTVSNEALESCNSNSTFDKPTELLETNFDYVDETSFEESQNEIKDIPLFKILEGDPRSPSTEIERTPIVVAKNSQESLEKNVEEMSDDTLIKVLQDKNAELRQSATTLHEDPEELLIYEDEAMNINTETPKKSKSGCSSGSRTPLSCMKNKADATHARSKSANTVTDDNNKKISKKVSHIPRLKSLSKQCKVSNGSTVSLKNITKPAVMSGDCENTPPHSHRDLWDKDSSIIL